MEIATQLALFLDNRPGMLARVCGALAEAGVNVYALTTSDTVDHTVIRMIVSDTRKALLLLEERGTLVVESQVLLVEDDNKPGSLSEIARKLAKAKVNIEYCYCATSARSKKGMLVLRVSSVDRAMKALQG